MRHERQDFGQCCERTLLGMVSRVGELALISRFREEKRWVQRDCFAGPMLHSWKSFHINDKSHFLPRTATSELSLSFRRKKLGVSNAQ